MAARETEQCSFPPSAPVAVCPAKIKGNTHRADLPSQKRKEPSECPVSLVLQDTVGDICVSTAASSAETGPP